MSDAKRVLVIGTGIGGAAAAAALRRAGLAVHAIDVRPDIPTTGTGICLLHNAVRALASLGMAEDCLALGFKFEVVRHFDSSGKALGSNPAPPGCGMRRTDLAHVLESHAVRAGANLEKGITATSLKETGNGVQVQFSDGREDSYDLVVAADGAYSGVRRKLFGAEWDPRFAGQSGWRFSAPRPPEVDGFCLFRLPDGRSAGALPTSKDTCYFFFLENSAEHLRMPADRLDVLIRERLAAYTAPVIRQAVEQISGPEAVLFRPYDITLVPAPWHRGRVVLLGDAAHAPTPQLTSGGGMAVEDAVVLAESLAAPGTVEQALERYSERRFSRVRRVYDASHQLCIYEQDPLNNKEKSMALLLESYQFLGQPY